TPRLSRSSMQPCAQEMPRERSGAPELAPTMLVFAEITHGASVHSLPAAAVATLQPASQAAATAAAEALRLTDAAQPDESGRRGGARPRARRRGPRWRCRGPAPRRRVRGAA